MGQKFQTHRNTLDSDGPKKYDLTGLLYKKTSTSCILLVKCFDTLTSYLFQQINFF